MLTRTFSQTTLGNMAMWAVLYSSFQASVLCITAAMWTEKTEKANGLNSIKINHRCMKPQIDSVQCTLC
jgi:hypothetical protein